MDQCDTKVGLIKQMWVSDLYFIYGPMILSYILKTIWWMKGIDDIMDQCDTKIDLIFKNIYTSVIIYFVTAILLNILKDIWWMNIIFGLMDQCDTKIDLIRYMQINDLYFMVQ